MKYSIEELDDMRASILMKAQAEFKGGNWNYIVDQLENKLRTYMINGTTPEELKQAAEEAAKKAWG